MDRLKFLILLFYYQRPVLVKNALESIKNQTYQNFEVVFIDDSEHPQRTEEGYKLYVEYFVDTENDTGYFPHTYICTKDIKEQKLARGGSMFGEFANQAMLKSDADVAIMLCDDDCLQPDYLEKLNRFYLDNPHILYSYCDVVVYDCLRENWKDKVGMPPTEGHFLNANHNPHCLGNSKDSSQCSWRLSCIREGGIRFPAPLTAALDYYLYIQLFAKYGNGVYNGICGQIKNFSECQLGQHGGYDRVD